MNINNEFHECSLEVSFNNGIIRRKMPAWFSAANPGLGYVQLDSGNFATVMRNGYAFCRYTMPHQWQIEEVCRRIAPLVDLGDPDQVYALYDRAHPGQDTLAVVVRRVFEDVLNEDATPAVVVSNEQRVQNLKDFVLDRDITESAPPFPL